MTRRRWQMPVAITRCMTEMSFPRIRCYLDDNNRSLFSMRSVLIASTTIAKSVGGTGLPDVDPIHHPRDLSFTYHHLYAQSMPLRTTSGV
jgi:hypothetical protein